MSENPHNWHPCFASSITVGRTYAFTEYGHDLFEVKEAQTIPLLFGGSRVIVEAIGNGERHGTLIFFTRDVVYLHTPDGIAPSIPRQPTG